MWSDPAAKEERMVVFEMGGAMVAKGCAAEDCCNGGIDYRA